MAHHTDRPGDETPTADAGAAPPIARRDALRTIAAAAAAVPLGAALPAEAPAQPPARRPATARAPLPVVGPRGTPTDPDLLRPRADWPRVLTAAERATLAALCDLILPADDHGPAASTVGVVAYIDEFVSAPYDWAEQARVRIRGGLTWLDTESRTRFGRPWIALTMAERTRIADDICHLPDARAEHRAAARFFAEVRNLTMTGYYTSDAGMKDIGYVGNVPLAEFPGPPREVLEKLGLA
jgi:hypothetical protein